MIVRHLNNVSIDSSENRRDIVVPTDAAITRKFVCGRRLVINLPPPYRFELGSVLTFDFRPAQRLHLAVCYELGRAGARHADRFLRLALDYLSCIGGSAVYALPDLTRWPLEGADGIKPMGVEMANAVRESYAICNMYAPKSPRAFPDRSLTPEIGLLQYWTPDAGCLRIRDAGAAPANAA